MRRRGRSLALLLLVVGLLLAAMPAQARHETDPHTRNLRPLGDTDDNRPVTSFLEPFFTDIAFWRDLAYQGTWYGGVPGHRHLLAGSANGAVRSRLRRLSG
jgi:hypothetical protein